MSKFLTHSWVVGSWDHDLDLKPWFLESILVGSADGLRHCMVLLDSS